MFFQIWFKWSFKSASCLLIHTSGFQDVFFFWIMFFTLQPNKFPTNGLRSKRNNRVLKELILSCAFNSTAEAGKVIISLRYLFLSSCRLRQKYTV